MGLVAERIARGGLFQAHHRHDIAGIDGVNVVAVVRMHLQDTADALTQPLHGVIDGCSGL